MAKRSVLMDTSFVVALGNRRDPHHERAKSLDRELLAEGATLVLHWGILIEIADGYARQNRRSRGIELIEKFASEDGYAVHPLTEALLADGRLLYCSYTDKSWSLTDCISFVLMRRESIVDALTADIDFRQAGFNAMLRDT